MNAIVKQEKRDSQEVAQRNAGYGLSPRVDIIETKDAYILEAEMPGINREGLEVLLEGAELTLIGRRRQEKTEAQLIYRESSSKDFHRVFVLDSTIDTARIEAKIENGLLALHLPKAEKIRPRKITIAG